MVSVGFVIEQTEGVRIYIDRFKEVFSRAKLPMSKSKLFSSFDSVTKFYGDRIVFIYSGVMDSFSLLMFFVKYVFFTLLMVNTFFYFNGNSTLLFYGVIALGVNVFVIGLYSLVTSKFYQWFMHKRTFKKKKYRIDKLKSRLLTNDEIVCCLLSGGKPKFNDEVE